MKIKKGDFIKIITGKHKNHTGQVLEINHQKNTLFIDGIVQKKHQKPTGDEKKGKIIEIPKPINVSNVMALDSKKKVATRIGYKFVKGVKVRFAKKTKKTY